MSWDQQLGQKVLADKLQEGANLGNGYTLHRVDHREQLPAAIRNQPELYQNLKKVSGEPTTPQPTEFYATQDGTLQKWDESAQKFSDIAPQDPLYTIYRQGNYQTEYLTGRQNDALIAAAVKKQQDFVTSNHAVYRIVQASKLSDTNIAYYQTMQTQYPQATDLKRGQPCNSWPPLIRESVCLWQIIGWPPTRRCRRPIRGSISTTC